MFFSSPFLEGGATALLFAQLCIFLGGCTQHNIINIIFSTGKKICVHLFNSLHTAPVIKKVLSVYTMYLSIPAYTLHRKNRFDDTGCKGNTLFIQFTYVQIVENVECTLDVMRLSFWKKNTVYVYKYCIYKKQCVRLMKKTFFAQKGFIIFP